MFERFTDEARRVVVLAQEEARLLGHNYIGTEHLLLGLTHEANGVAAEALESFGISLVAIRAAVEDIIGVGGSEPSGHIPFTPRAKRVMELSLREALQLGDNYIGGEHLLLGLVREGEGVGAQVLIGLGADLSSVRQRVVQVLARETRSPSSGPRASVARIVVGSSIGGIFEPALNESRRLGDDHVGTEHVLLAAFEEPGSLAGRVLESFGLTKPDVEQRIIEMRGKGEQATPE